MNKYQHMSNINTQRVAVKIGVVSAKALIILVVAPAMAFNFMTAIGMQMIESIIVTIIAVIFAIFCLAKDKYNPVEGNFKLMINAVLMDQKKYFPLDRIRDYDQNNSKNSY
ncbi:hypothetical protein EQ500_01565 [Lactobacillus sp. XV13L]|nr:hypothetical protein [Lactobacillus sp. XV13L]